MRGKIKVPSRWRLTNWFQPLYVDFDEKELYKANWIWGYNPTDLTQLKDASIDTTWIDWVMLLTTHTLIIETYNDKVPKIIHPGVPKGKPLYQLLTELTDYSAKGTIKMEQG